MHHSERLRATVLVVDDEPTSLAFICDALDDAGFTLLVATDGGTALQRLHRIEPDAVLLDANMPGMDGFEVCRRIKAEPAWSAVPVIFMTALCETAHIVEGFRCGGVDYVTKPVHPEELIARLRTHTRNARAIRHTRVALDIAGHAIIVTTLTGTLLWRSDLAEKWLREFYGSTAGALPPDLQQWLMAEHQQNGGAATFEAVAGARRLVIRAIGTINSNERLLLLHVSDGPVAHRSSNHLPMLTARETDVLYWLARGKTNRDIGEILEMSPRTVSKHLEHIYEKLGVETRAAATARALQDALVQTF